MSSADTFFPNEENANSARSRCDRWARSQLGVSPDATLEDLRSAFWRRLGEQPELPPEELRVAFDYLQRCATGPVPMAYPELFLRAEENRLRRDVESFAAKMFHLPPAQRRQRWSELREQCQGWSVPLARCEALQRGLDVDLAALDREKPDVAALGQLLCEMSIQVPSRRAVMRQQIRDLWKDEPYLSSRAAKRLRSRHPKFAALDPGLVEECVKAPALAHLPVATTPRQTGQRQDQNPWSMVAPAVFIAFVLILGVVGNTERDRRENERKRQDDEFQQRINRIEQDLLQRMNEISRPSWKPGVSRLEKYLREHQDDSVPQEQGELLRQILNPQDASDSTPADAEGMNAEGALAGSTPEESVVAE